MKIKFQLTSEQFKILEYNLNGCIHMCNFRFIEGMELFYNKAKPFVVYTFAKTFMPGWKEVILQLQKLYFKDFHGDYENIESSDALKLQILLQKMLDAFNEVNEVNESNEVNASKESDAMGSRKSKESYSFEVDMSEEEVSLLKYYLDLPTRIVSGQWDRLIGFLKATTYKGDFVDTIAIAMTRGFIGDYRNKCIVFYRSKGLAAGASFGIYSQELSKNVRELYDFYKVLMYESGAKGCYGFPVKKPANTASPLPIIEFPLEYMDEFHGDIATFEKQWNANKREPLKKFSDEPDKLYLPVGEYTYQFLRPGDKIYKKRNGYYVVK